MLGCGGVKMNIEDVLPERPEVTIKLYRSLSFRIKVYFEIISRLTVPCLVHYQECRKGVWILFTHLL